MVMRSPALRWVKAAAGNPITNGCILYLPLWSSGLGGSTFKSVDAYQHSCTVTGAVHVSQGRDFDAIDDLIDLGTNSVLAMEDNDFTFIAWCEADAFDSGTVSAILSPDSSNNGGAGLTVNSATGNVGLAKQGVAFYDSSLAISTGTWYMIGVVFDSTAVTNNATIYRNTDSEAVTANVDFTTGKLTNQMGKYFDAADRYWEGTIGTVWMYNRKLTAGEMTHIYNSTRGRFGV